MAAFEFLPAPLLPPRLSAAGEVPGARREARQCTLGKERQRLHIAVRAGSPDASKGDASQRGGTDHRDQ